VVVQPWFGICGLVGGNSNHYNQCTTRNSVERKKEKEKEEKKERKAS